MIKARTSTNCTCLGLFTWFAYLSKVKRKLSNKNLDHIIKPPLATSFFLPCPLVVHLRSIDEAWFLVVAHQYVIDIAPQRAGNARGWIGGVTGITLFRSGFLNSIAENGQISIQRHSSKHVHLHSAFRSPICMHAALIKGK